MFFVNLFWLGNKEICVLQSLSFRHLLELLSYIVIYGTYSCNMKSATNAYVINYPFIRGANKINRDILIYILWRTGWYNTQEIGDLFCLGYSATRRRNEKFNKRIIKIKSLIKVGH